jgi:hypothetical protein
VTSPPPPAPVIATPPPPPAPLVTTPDVPAVDPWSVPPPGSARSRHAGAAAASIAIAAAKGNAVGLVGMAAVLAGPVQIVVRYGRNGARHVSGEMAAAMTSES